MSKPQARLGVVRVALALIESPSLRPRIPHPDRVRTTTDRVVDAVIFRMKSGVHIRGTAGGDLRIAVDVGNPAVRENQFPREQRYERAAPAGSAGHG